MKNVLGVGSISTWGSLLPPWMAFRKPENCLASFPLDLAITPMVACSDPLVGAHIQKLCDREDVDAETSLILFLMLQRLLGSKSRWSSWMVLLPTDFHLPLQYTDAQLEDLKGTTLFSAVIVQRNSLRLRWEALGPLFDDICAQVKKELSCWNIYFLRMKDCFQTSMARTCMFLKDSLSPSSATPQDLSNHLLTLVLKVNCLDFLMLQLYQVVFLGLQGHQQDSIWKIYHLGLEIPIA